ncbi:hypothetical protein Tco_1376051 [Tanacetum coccineum]
MSMTIQSSVKDKILATSSETSKVENAPAEMLRDLDQQMEKRADDGKANVVTDALSRKERVKPRRVRAMAMIIQYGVKGMILIAQSEVFKQENVRAERLHRTAVWTEAHASWYLDAAESVSYHSRIGVARLKIVWKGKCRSLVLWAEIEERDQVMLKVSPWKGVIRFGKKGKLRLPEELSGIKVDKTLRFVEEPVENSDREVKRLKCSRMVVVKAKWLAVRYLVKVSWNSKCNFELTWVWEDYLKDKYP